MKARKYFKEYFDTEPELPYSLDAVEFAEAYYKHRLSKITNKKILRAITNTVIIQQGNYFPYITNINDVVKSILRLLSK